MEALYQFFDFFMHIGPHIADLAARYGTVVYVLLFLIVFCESGVILTPVLPGDSMLFVIGALSATGKLSLQVLIISLSLAAILGYWFNYFIGTILAEKVIAGTHLKFIKRQYIERTELFFKKYGPKALILARFMPFTRTFAAFLAGVGRMKFSHFQFYNVISAFLWIPSIIVLGYFFGNIPFIKDNFTYVIFTIIIVSILPIAYEWFKHRNAT